jgi:hypothetical protein
MINPPIPPMKMTATAITITLVMSIHQSLGQKKDRPSAAMLNGGPTILIPPAIIGWTRMNKTTKPAVLHERKGNAAIRFFFPEDAPKENTFHRM